ncbi:MAG TPA: hypothetical protein VFR58_07940 [Flavisolibacter sp.]|nr:hypothetical protein [Flavisolibacter sp.]
MKNLMLLALGLCIALFTGAQTKITAKQPETGGPSVDSIQIIPFEGAKIFLLGHNFEKLGKENNLELLKNKFIQDYRESSVDEEFPKGAKEIIYLYGKDGRRRLKARPEDIEPVDMQKEISSFNANLPSVHYTIYDLPKEFEYHIYLSSPEQLDQLFETNCALILSQAFESKKASDFYRWSWLEISKPDSSWSITRKATKRNRQIEFSTFVGAHLILSSWAPMFGFDVDYRFINKYGQSKFKIGIDVSNQVLANYEKLDFTNRNLVSAFSIRILGNPLGGARSAWSGFSFGQYRTSEPNILNKATKFGFVSELGPLGVEFNFIREDNSMALSLRYYF